MTQFIEVNASPKDCWIELPLHFQIWVASSVDQWGIAAIAWITCMTLRAPGLYLRRSGTRTSRVHTYLLQCLSTQAGLGGQVAVGNAASFSDLARPHPSVMVFNAAELSKRTHLQVMFSFNADPVVLRKLSPPTSPS